MRLALTLLFLLTAPHALAHKGSDAYWTLVPDGAGFSGQLDLSLGDLHAAIGLDDDADGALTWPEVIAHRQALEAWVRGGLRVDGCALELGDLAAIRHSDGLYASWLINGTCAAPLERLELTYDLLFDVDATHRGLITIGHDEWRAASASSRVVSFELAPSAPSRQFFVALREGVHHLAIGWDHLCFLFALLLPSVLRREARAWVARETLTGTLVEVTRVVTAFTLAHSLTLGLAAFGVLAPNPAAVEVAIALSVLFAALNTLFPVVTDGRWTLAFGLGLLHGFGFVSALSDLGARGGQLLVSLLGFNLGVEVGQLAIVACFVPLAFLVRRFDWYPRRLLPVGGVVLVLVASRWTWERLTQL